jgi:hypothetical protein
LRPNFSKQVNLSVSKGSADDLFKFNESSAELKSKMPILKAAIVSVFEVTIKLDGCPCFQMEF